MNVVEVNGLSKRYKIYDRSFHRIKEWIAPAGRRYHREFYALNDVSFSLGKGEALGIVGPNGAGKSTLLKILTGTTTATSGEFRLDGRVAALLELGAGFHPEFTGRDNIVMNAKLLGLSDEEIEGKLDEIIEFSELEDFIDLPVRTYSSGMYVRLGFSIACGIDPDILIIDEALSVGDAYFSQKSINRIEAFLENGTTILFVSHDMRTLQRFCEEAMWLNEGRVQSYGDCKNVVTAYESYTKEKEFEYKKRRQKELTAALVGRDSTQVRKKDYKVIGDTWGTGEAIITKVEMLDSKGERRWVFERNEKAILRIYYYAFEKIKNPIFGINVHRIDGVYIMGSDNYETRPLVIDEIEGEGFVDFALELMLHKGTYFWSVGIAVEPDPPYWSELADFHNQAYEFRVESDIVAHGVVDLPSHWEVGVETPDRKEFGAPVEIEISDKNQRRFLQRGWESIERRGGADFYFAKEQGNFLMYVPDGKSRLLIDSFYSLHDIEGMGGEYTMKAGEDICKPIADKPRAKELEFEIPADLGGTLCSFVLTFSPTRGAELGEGMHIGVRRIWFG